VEVIGDLPWRVRFPVGFDGSEGGAELFCGSNTARAMRFSRLKERP
jgi:hypothetical protein